MQHSADSSDLSGMPSRKHNMNQHRSIVRRAGIGFARAPRNSGLPAIVGSHPYLAGAAASAVALAVTAFVNHRLAAAAERRNPPAGKFVEVDGVRLHYIEQGKASRWSSCMATAA